MTACTRQAITCGRIPHLQLCFVSFGKTWMVTLAQTVNDHKTIVVRVLSEQLDEIFIALGRCNNDTQPRDERQLKTE